MPPALIVLVPLRGVDGAAFHRLRRGTYDVVLVGCLRIGGDLSAGSFSLSVHGHGAVVVRVCGRQPHIPKSEEYVENSVRLFTRAFKYEHAFRCYDVLSV